MSKYYVSGYKTPEDVRNSEDVKRYQKMLGVKCDGIWGKNTQKAYDEYQSKQNKSRSSSAKNNAKGGIDDFDWDKATNEITKQLASALRPAVDSAINQRRESMGENSAEIDADAAARGMESSSFVSSMKQREAQDAQTDISDMEASYQSTLASNLYSALMSLYDTYSENRIAEENIALEREKLAQEKEIADEQLAYQKSLAKAASKANASSGNDKSNSDDKGENTSGAMPKAGYDYAAYYEFVRLLSQDGRKDLFESDEVYWNWARQQILGDIGVEGFYVLYNQFCNDITGEVDFPYDYASEDTE